MRGGVRGGVTGGDNGDFGLTCADCGGDDEREHVFDIIAGLEGGFAGIGRQAAFPADCALDLVVGCAWNECVCLLSFLDNLGGVGGRSPESSSENEVLVVLMLSMMGKWIWLSMVQGAW